MHPKRDTVWYAFWFRGIIGLFLFENGDRYRAMLNEFLLKKNWKLLHATQPKLQSMFAALLLKIIIISRRAEFVWPPRSCDLTLFNYYLWGAVKDNRYADKPETTDFLEDNIREAVGDIQPTIMCLKIGLIV